MRSKFLKKFLSSRSAVIGAVIILFLVLVAIFAPWLAPVDPAHIFEGSLKFAPVWRTPSSNLHFFGTDDIGRDLMSRIIYGARVSLGVGFLVVTFSLLIGTFFGYLAGYIGGRVDSLIMRMVDLLMAVPSVLLAIVVVAILGPNLINGVIAVTIVGLPSFIRVVRAAVMVEKEKLFVSASRGFGAGPHRLAFKHILPNCAAPLIVQATLGFSDGILNVAALGFLGLGAQAPTPEWGTMLADGKSYIESASWLVTLPGSCILLSVLGFNLLGDGLRDVLDPKTSALD